MTAPFPHRYEVSLDRTSRAHANLAALGRPSITGAAPPEFDGDPAAWAPEHLLLGAIGLCLETTFDALATRDRLPIDAWHATASGTLDKTRTGLQFTRFVLAVDLTVAAEDVERARALLERAHQVCIVSRALSVPVELEATVRTAATPAA